MMSLADAGPIANAVRAIVMRGASGPLHGKPAGIRVGVRQGDDCPIIVVTVNRSFPMPPMPSEYQGCDVVVEYSEG